MFLKTSCFYSEQTTDFKIMNMLTAENVAGKMKLLFQPSFWLSNKAPLEHNEFMIKTTWHGRPCQINVSSEDKHELSCNNVDVGIKSTYALLLVQT